MRVQRILSSSLVETRALVPRIASRDGLGTRTYTVFRGGIDLKFGVFQYHLRDQDDLRNVSFHERNLPSSDMNRNRDMSLYILFVRWKGRCNEGL